MVTIIVPTSDQIVWNKDLILIEFIKAVKTQQPILLDFISEGPDVEHLDLIELLVNICNINEYPLDQVTLNVSNIVQTESRFTLNKCIPWHFVESTRNHLNPTNKKFGKEFKRFGIFIGRSNHHRLQLSSYLWNKYPKLTLQTFHYNPQDDFHRNNLGLEKLIKETGNADIQDIAYFLKQCPIKGHDNPGYPILMDAHCDINVNYPNFFVEIVCESYFTGNTFFPTEKTWRAIVNRTPFIIQGPQYYLHRLRDLGFKTFGDHWDEGYAEDPSTWQTIEILKVVDQLATLNPIQVEELYFEMQHILDHNYNRFLELTQEDFINVRK